MRIQPTPIVSPREKNFENQSFFRFILLILLIGGLGTGTGYAQTRIFPQSPLLIEPASGAVLQYPGGNVKVLFSWDSVQGVSGYEINVVKKNTPIAHAQTGETQIELDLQLQSSDVGMTFSWSVLSVSGTVRSNDPSLRTFSLSLQGTPLPTPTMLPTPTPLPPPTLFNPTDRSDFSPFEQVIPFGWEAVTGASSYRIVVYKDNEPYLERVSSSTDQVVSFQQQTYDVFQWEVLSIDSSGHSGHSGMRRSFSIGKGVLPTPTPMPLNPDIDQNGVVDIHDLYQYATRFTTNDPRVDFDNSGLNESNDLLEFLELFVAAKK